MDILLWGSIFAAGLLSFFSPCVLPLFPVYFGVLMSERGNRSIKIGKFEVAVLPVVRTFLFVAGISTIFFNKNNCFFARLKAFIAAVEAIDNTKNGIDNPKI